MKEESDITKLLRLLWQQQELIDYLLDNRIDYNLKITGPIDYMEEIKRIEIRLLQSALDSTNYNYQQAAKLLKLKKTTFYQKLLRLGLHTRKLIIYRKKGKKIV